MEKLYRMKHIPGFETPESILSSGCRAGDTRVLRGDFIPNEDTVWIVILGGNYDTALFRKYEIER